MLSQAFKSKLKRNNEVAVRKYRKQLTLKLALPLCRRLQRNAEKLTNQVMQRTDKPLLFGLLVAVKVRSRNLF